MTKDLGERIKSWYESFGVCPPWSSVVGFVVRENKKSRSQTIKEVMEIVEKIAGDIYDESYWHTARHAMRDEIKSKLKKLT